MPSPSSKSAFASIASIASIGSTASFLPMVYLHLLAGTGITFASSKHPLSESPVYKLIVLVVPLFLVMALCFMSAGPLKYATGLLFCVLLGQGLSSLVKKLEHKELLTQVMASVLGIFLAMSAVGFYDNQNLLGFGGYLLAALVGLILARVALLLYAYFNGIDSKTGSSINTALSWFGTALFSIYVAFDTQRVKEDAKLKKRDYVQSSLGLYLDIINLFTGVSDILDA